MADEQELLGLAEVSVLAGVSAQAVANWRARFADFPAPVAELRAGPVFDKDQVKRWLRRHKGSMTTVIATINLKGGVGKTTTTVALAEFLSAEYRKRVLVIDLDPQTNATTVLIGEEQWGKLNDAGHTLATLFRDALESDPTRRVFDLDATLQSRVSAVADVRRVDLLPSSLDLIDVQDRLGTMPAGRYFANTPIEILNRALAGRLDEYDYVIVDCPPNLGIITLNGLRLADGYIIPTIPDVLSTYGIPQIVRRVSEFAGEVNQKIELYGIVVSKYREQSTMHRQTLEGLRRGTDPVFKTVIPEANAIAASAEFVQLSTLRQKYSYGNRYELFSQLTQEIMEASEP
jgi:chromosome partitioning protein